MKNFYRIKETSFIIVRIINIIKANLVLRKDNSQNFKNLNMYIKFNVDPRRGYHPHCPLYNWYLDFDQLSGYADINEELKN